MLSDTALLDVGMYTNAAYYEISCRNYMLSYSKIGVNNKIHGKRKITNAERK